METDTIEPQPLRTITVGTGLCTPRDFFNEISSSEDKYLITDRGHNALFSPFQVSDTEEKLNLVSLTVSELGFEAKASLKEILAGALTIGLQLCPAEVGPQLRLQYSNQPQMEWLAIGMEPVVAPDGRLYIFAIVHDKMFRWLGAFHAGPQVLWRKDRRFVFVQPQ